LTQASPYLIENLYIQPTLQASCTAFPVSFVVREQQDIAMCPKCDNRYGNLRNNGVGGFFYLGEQTAQACCPGGLLPRRLVAQGECSSCNHIVAGFMHLCCTHVNALNSDTRRRWLNVLGDLRAVNVQIIDMYHLKSLHSTIGSEVSELLCFAVRNTVP